MQEQFFRPEFHAPWPPIEILPRSDRLQSNGTIFELMGLPRAGKSTMLMNLQDTLQQRIPGLRVVIQTEFGEDASKYSVVKHSSLLSLEAEGLFWNRWRLRAYQQGLKRYNDFLANSSSPVLYMIERGPNDVLVTDQFFRNRRKAGDDPKLHFPKNVEAAELYVQAIETLNQPQSPDAVILYGVSVESAMRRREAEGKGAQGRLINPQAWSHLEDAHSFWLKHHYAQLRNQGVGLCIIDGEGDLSENSQQVYNYLYRIIDR